VGADSWTVPLAGSIWAVALTVALVAAGWFLAIRGLRKWVNASQRVTLLIIGSVLVGGITIISMIYAYGVSTYYHDPSIEGAIIQQQAQDFVTIGWVLIASLGVPALILFNSLAEIF
jgi:hypothetical protein